MASSESILCTKWDFVPPDSNTEKAASHVQGVFSAMTVLAYGIGRECLHQGNQ